MEGRSGPQPVVVGGDERDTALGSVCPNKADRLRADVQVRESVTSSGLDLHSFPIFPERSDMDIGELSNADFNSLAFSMMDCVIG